MTGYGSSTPPPPAHLTTGILPFTGAELGLYFIVGLLIVLTGLTLRKWEKRP